MYLSSGIKYQKFRFGISPIVCKNAGNQFLWQDKDIIIQHNKPQKGVKTDIYYAERFTDSFFTKDHLNNMVATVQFQFRVFLLRMVKKTKKNDNIKLAH